MFLGHCHGQGAHAMWVGASRGPLASAAELVCRAVQALPLLGMVLVIRCATVPSPVAPQRWRLCAQWSLPSATTICLLALIPGLHARNEGIALIPAVVLIGVVQGDAHTFVLVPFVPDITAFDGVLYPLLLHTKTARSTPAHFHQHLMAFVLLPKSGVRYRRC